MAPAARGRFGVQDWGVPTGRPARKLHRSPHCTTVLVVGEKQGDRLHQRPSGAADQAEDGRDTTMAIYSTPLLLLAAASLSLVGAQSRFPVASLDYDMILREVSLTLTFTNIQLLKKLVRQN